VCLKRTSGCDGCCQAFSSNNLTTTFTLISVKMELWVGTFLLSNNCAPPVLDIKKIENGIISSWEGYTTNKDCLWIHHWLLLQFVHPSFTVPCKTDLNEKHPDGIANMSRGLHSSEPCMRNWLATTTRFTMNIHALELFGLVLRLCLSFRLCVHYRCFI
jgi:hypothetical protein